MLNSTSHGSDQSCSWVSIDGHFHAFPVKSLSTNIQILFHGLAFKCFPGCPYAEDLVPNLYSNWEVVGPSEGGAQGEDGGSLGACP